MQQAAPALRAPAALSLPFFDDFSGANTLNTQRWNSTGVTVNNRFGFEPLTKNVASLDGLNSLGMPYAPGSVSAGASDTLASAPILLGGLTPADSVYLSFYWQSGGLGDVPDLTENNLRYLVLEFKDNTGSWQEVWRQSAVGRATDFAQFFVGLREPRYFHSGFQFRFRNIGLRNGLADVWNLDYIVLDKNRRKGQNTTRDIAISEGVSRLLKHYTAMPARQFLQNPEAELAEEVRATLNNLGNMPGAISWRGYVKRLGATSADTFLRGQALIPAMARQYEIAGTPTLAKTRLPASGEFTLQHGILLDTKEQNPLQRTNDSTARKTVFSDYYAYDDGTAEAGFSFVSSGNGNVLVAQRYDLSQPDQVSAFRVYFPKVGKSIEGTFITFRVWAAADSLPGETLYQQNFSIRYSTIQNEFYEVVLDKPVPVEGSFYVGWSQPSSQYINIGFDRNESAAGRRFTYTVATGWIEEAMFDGAVMLRPVLKGEPLGIEDERYSKAMRVYPNPSTGEVNLSAPYEQVQVYDMLGRLLHSQQYKAGQQTLQLGHLSPGLYTLRIQNRKAIITKKIILTKP